MFPQQIIEELLSVAHVQAVADRAGVSISNFDKDFGVDRHRVNFSIATFSDEC
jgi:hypothetical protein